MVTGSAQPQPSRDETWVKPPVEKTPEVAAAIGILDAEINALTAMASMLAERLHPVLSPRKEATPVNPVSHIPVFAAPLAARIGQRAADVNHLAALLAEIRDAVQV